LPGRPGVYRNHDRDRGSAADGQRAGCRARLGARSSHRHAATRVAGPACARKRSIRRRRKCEHRSCGRAAPGRVVDVGDRVRESDRPRGRNRSRCGRLRQTEIRANHRHRTRKNVGDREAIIGGHGRRVVRVEHRLSRGTNRHLHGHRQGGAAVCGEVGGARAHHAGRSAHSS